MQLDIQVLPSACAVTDTAGAVLAANSELGRLTGIETHLLQARNLEDLLTVGSKAFFQTHVLPTLRKEGRLREVFMYLKAESNRRRPVYINARETLAAGGAAEYVWLFFTADERTHFENELIVARRQAEANAQAICKAHERMRELHAQLQVKVSDSEIRFQHASELAKKDSLTCLGNRRVLQETAYRLSSRGSLLTKFSVLMVDIDHFKQINDLYGHVKGDEVLVDVAQCLVSIARVGDVVVRYGGEEFCLVLMDADAYQAMTVANRIRQQLSDCKPAGLSLTVSVGVATSGEPIEELFEVLSKADEALYRAKRSGRDRCVHAQMSVT